MDFFFTIESGEAFKKSRVYLRINKNRASCSRMGVYNQQLASHAHSFRRVECLRHLNCLPFLSHTYTHTHYMRCLPRLTVVQRKRELLFVVR